MADVSAEQELVASLRKRDEAAFERLTALYYPSMIRTAMFYVRDRASAEDVIQETWAGVVAGIDGFEERSSLKTWIFRILVNQAKRRGMKDAPSVPVTSFAEEKEWRSVDPARFFDETGAQPGHWRYPPQEWPDEPSRSVEEAELREVLMSAIASLPDAQRAVIQLRDIDGWPAEDVCNVLDLSDTNQRVLLHRARTQVRKALARYLAGEE